MSLELTDTNFNEVVLKSDKPVLVDFWAEWCGPCRMMGPVVEELSKEFEGKAVIAKLNVDKYPGISTEFAVMSIPTLLILKKGKVVDKKVGVVAKRLLEAKLNDYIAG